MRSSEKMGRMKEKYLFAAIPVQAAMPEYSENAKVWIPACAGMTDG